MFNYIYEYFYPTSHEPTDSQKRLRHLVMTQIKKSPNIQGILKKHYDKGFLDYELNRLTRHSHIPTNKKRKKRNKK
jgi:hypothetical protein